MDGAFDAALRKGSGEVLILAMLEDRARHGDEIARLTELQSEGAFRFNVPSFCPLLYQLEKRGFINGKDRKGRPAPATVLRITPEGRKTLEEKRSRWEQFSSALSQLAVLSDRRLR